MRHAWVVLYIVVGVPQFVAIRAGLEHWFGMGSLTAGLGALPLAYVPVLGAAASALAVLGQWSRPYLWIAIVLAAGGVVIALRGRRPRSVVREG